MQTQTRQRRRGRGPQRDPWSTGYAYPSSVIDEVAEIDRVAMVSESGGNGILGGLGGLHGSLGCTSLSHPTLSGTTIERGPTIAAGKKTAMNPSTITVGSTNDPIANFGRHGAAAVLEYVRSVPVSMRADAMRQFLDILDPGLWTSVADKAAELERTKGYPAAVALEKSLSAMLANRLLDQFAKIGATGQAPMGGLLGLTHSRGQARALEGILDTITKPFKQAGAAIANAGQATGSAISGGASSAYNAAKDAVNKLGSLACKTVGNPATANVAAAVPHPAGQAVAAGAVAAQALCGGGTSPVTQTPYTEPSFFTPPVIIGGVAVLGLLAVVALKK